MPQPARKLTPPDTVRCFVDRALRATVPSRPYPDPVGERATSNADRDQDPDAASRRERDERIRRARALLDVSHPSERMGP